jgi:RNA polymerase sigma factor (TIGR02999 family)
MIRESWEHSSETPESHGPLGMNTPTRVVDFQGDGESLSHERLVPVLYNELRLMARAALRRERPDHSLQATDLVHEVYLRLTGGMPVKWRGRRHFFHAAAEAMRRILIEHARRRGRAKRGGRGVRVELSSVNLADEHDLEQILALDDAFRRLEEVDRQAADVVRLRFFAGLSVAETAHALDLSERTVKREWAFARAWMYDALGYGDTS